MARELALFFAQIFCIARNVSLPYVYMDMDETTDFHEGIICHLSALYDRLTCHLHFLTHSSKLRITSPKYAHIEYDDHCVSFNRPITCNVNHTRALQHFGFRALKEDSSRSVMLAY